MHDEYLNGNIITPELQLMHRLERRSRQRQLFPARFFTRLVSEQTRNLRLVDIKHTLWFIIRVEAKHRIDERTQRDNSSRRFVLPRRGLVNTHERAVQERIDRLGEYNRARQQTTRHVGANHAHTFRQVDMRLVATISPSANELSKPFLEYFTARID